MAADNPHILVYPLPAPGHIIPILDLTHQLLSRGLTITFLITPINMPLLQPFLSSNSSSHFHQLVLPDPPKISLLADLRSIHDRHYPLIADWFKSQNTPPVAIISDFFLGWTHQFSIPNIVFCSSSAFAFSVTSSLWKNQPQNENLNDMDFIVSFPEIPNSPSHPWWQISYIYRTSKVGDPNREFFRDCFVANLASYGIIVNSFVELEQVYLDHLRKTYGNDSVWSVGPLLLNEDGASTRPINHGGSSSVPCHELMTWLEQQKDDSVVYICFGSREMLTCKQMDELASALEKSEVHFIWGARLPNEGHTSGEYGVLPDGFEDRVAGRGFIIKGWAPQVAILNHRGVGAFLTHCGWNSVLEGIASGVVMLTWPMGADQFINAQLLVDQLGIGIRVGEDEQKIPESNILARILAESVEENRPERLRSKKLKEAALDAVKGGSSDKDMDELVKRLIDLAKANEAK